MEDTSSSSEERPDYSDGGEISSSVAPSRRTTPRTPKTSKPPIDDTTRTPAKNGPSIQPPAEVENSFQHTKKPHAEGTVAVEADDPELNEGSTAPVVEAHNTEITPRDPSPAIDPEIIEKEKKKKKKKREETEEKKKESDETEVRKKDKDNEKKKKREREKGALDPKRTKRGTHTTKGVKQVSTTKQNPDKRKKGPF